MYIIRALFVCKYVFIHVVAPYLHPVDQKTPLFPADKKPDDDEEDYESDDGQDKEAGEEEEGAVNELLAEAEEEVMEELEAEESLGLLSREEEQILDELEEKELEGKLGTDNFPPSLITHHWKVLQTFHSNANTCR